MSPIIDTHVHLYDLPDIKSALIEAFHCGVSDVITLGVDVAANRQHLAICASGELYHKEAPRIHLALGLHPGNITSGEIEESFSLFRSILQEGVVRVVAIGETGLDFQYGSVRHDDVKKKAQREVFQRHLELANEFDLPVVIHCRGAWRECLEMSLRAGVKKANFHWYSGPVDVLKAILEAGYAISVSPSLEYSSESRLAALSAPLDRILVETDTPVRGWTPKDVWRTFKALCALKGVEEVLALDVVNASARQFFNI